jgi:type I restriction enzyme S subunit
VSDMNIPGNETEIISALNYITPELAKKLKVRVWPVGTVIFPKVGAALLTDKRRILARDTIFDNNIMGLIGRDMIIHRFLFLFMTRIRMSEYFQSGALPSISNGIVSEIEISLPPLQEQKRIVDLISSFDEVISISECAKAEIKNLRSGLLSDLLSGEHEIPESYDLQIGLVS